MKKVLVILFDVIVAAATAIGLDIIIPFTSVKGIEYLQGHGKGILFLIALFNVFVGAGISAGFLSKSFITGFRQWFLPPVIKGKWNATYGFAIFVLVINILWILLINP